MCKKFISDKLSVAPSLSDRVYATLKVSENRFLAIMAAIRKVEKKNYPYCYDTGRLNLLTFSKMRSGYMLRAKCLKTNFFVIQL